MRATNIGGDALDNPFEFIEGDPNIKVTSESHGLSVNDWINFTVVDDAGFPNKTSVAEAISADDFKQAHGFQVTEVLSSAVYTFYLVDWTTGSVITPATDAEDKGGDVTYYYKISSGISTEVSGQGWGAGLWGGNGIPTAVDLLDDPIAGVGATSTARITSAGHTVLITDSVYLMGIESGVVDGVELSILNDNWWDVIAVVAGTSFDITLPVLPDFTAGSIAGGGDEVSYYTADADGVVDGATRGWGQPSDQSEIIATLRRPYIDNYGEDVLYANSGGPIYYWDVDQNTSSGVPLGTELGVAKQLNDEIFVGNSHTPFAVDSFLVSKKDGHCVALGCNDVGVEDGTINSLLVRWSDQNNPFDWLPSITNTSGGQVLRVGSQILGGISTKDEVVIFTDSAVYSMRFVGPPDVFSFNLITQGVEIVSSLAAVNASNAVFFMGRDGFYVYTGSVSPLPCPVANYVFDDFNETQKVKCFGAVNSAFSEVMWFYPTAGAFEPDRFVMFNYNENVWSIGSFDMGGFDSEETATNPYSRTSWRDAIITSTPMSTYITDYAPATTADNLVSGDTTYTVPLLKKSAVMVHENGTSAQGEMLDAYIESGEVDISDGERLSFYSRIIPDLQIFNASGESANVTISLNGRDFPGQSASQKTSTDVDFTVVSPNSSSTFTPVNNATSIRGRARSVSMKVESSAVDFQWRLGDTRLDMRPDGRR